MLKKIINTMYLLLTNPDKGWEKVSKDRYKHEEFMSNFLFPILGVVSLTTLIGALWIDGVGLQNALRLTIFVVTSLFAGFYLTSFMVTEMLPKYGAIKDKNNAQQFVGYSSIIVYLLFLIMPFINGFQWLWVISLASYIVIYRGSRYFLDIYGVKGYRFSAISLVGIVIFPMLINYLFNLLVV